MRILTSFSVINDSVGKRVGVTYSEIDNEGNILKGNVRTSYVLIDNEDKKLVAELENRILEKINKI